MHIVDAYSSFDGIPVLDDYFNGNSNRHEYLWPLLNKIKGPKSKAYGFENCLHGIRIPIAFQTTANIHGKHEYVSCPLKVGKLLVISTGCPRKSTLSPGSFLFNILTKNAKQVRWYCRQKFHKSDYWSRFLLILSYSLSIFQHLATHNDL